MDHTSLSPGRFRLWADIYLVPAASGTVTSETMRNALMISGLLAGEISGRGCHRRERCRHYLV